MHAAMAASINSLLSMKLPPDFCGTQTGGYGAGHEPEMNVSATERSGH
jgi:hypothetical protein